MARTRSAPAASSFSIKVIARAIARGSPASTRSASAKAIAQGRGRSLEQLAGDDQALNLAGAFPYRGELHVPEELLGRIVFHEAVAAVNLHAIVGDPHRNFTRIQLRHRGFHRRAGGAIDVF